MHLFALSIQEKHAKKIRAVLDDFQPDVVHLKQYTVSSDPLLLFWKLTNGVKKQGKNVRLFTRHMIISLFAQPWNVRCEHEAM